jgi:hypothetical protein
MGLDELESTSAKTSSVPQSDRSLDDTPLRIRCANCGELLAAPARTVSVGGTATPVFVNPAGIFFELLLLLDLTNIFVLGSPTTEASWFPGYAWRCVVCRLCVRHVGWRWDRAAADADAPTFCGLIRDRIVVDGVNELGDGANPST